MGGTQAKNLGLIASIVLTVWSAPCWSERLDFGDATGARKLLSDKVLNTITLPDVRVGQLLQNAENLTNSDNKASYAANVAFHSKVESSCLQWASIRDCSIWLPPYVAEHGLEGGADKSPLETQIAAAWQTLGAADGAVGAQNGYSIWNVTTKNGLAVRQEADAWRGSLDLENLVDWRLKPEVQQIAEQIGTRAADRAILSTFGAGENIDETMPNMESLRTMAQAWTITYRNRMLANLGQIRAARPGTEFMLDEAGSNCDQYLTAALQLENQQLVPNSMFFRERKGLTRGQGDNFTQNLQRRYQNCIQMVQTPINLINPTIVGNGVQAGDVNDERYDEAAARISIAMIDYVGLGINEVPKPAEMRLTNADISNQLADYEVGGQRFDTEVKTNAQQVESYNQALYGAAQGYRDVAARSDLIQDKSEQVLDKQIAMKSVGLINLNGLTQFDMKPELQNTESSNTETYVRSGQYNNQTDDRLEQSYAGNQGLVVRRVDGQL